LCPSFDHATSSDRISKSLKGRCAIGCEIKGRDRPRLLRPPSDSDDFARRRSNFEPGFIVVASDPAVGISRHEGVATERTWTTADRHRSILRGTSRGPYGQLKPEEDCEDIGFRAALRKRDNLQRDPLDPGRSLCTKGKSSAWGHEDRPIVKSSDRERSVHPPFHPHGADELPVRAHDRIPSQPAVNDQHRITRQPD
jgi:hypothetical protein